MGLWFDAFVLTTNTIDKPNDTTIDKPNNTEKRVLLYISVQSLSNFKINWFIKMCINSF